MLDRTEHFPMEIDHLFFLTRHIPFPQLDSRLIHRTVADKLLLLQSSLFL